MDVILRQATPQDWLAVKTLAHSARWSTPNLWQWEEYLDDELFVVAERRRALVGAFLACPDESPVAWVRFAALESAIHLGAWLGLVLPPTLEHLRQRGVRSLAWMDYRGWASQRLPAHGFGLLAKVITLAKGDRALPQRHAADVLVRPATAADIPSVIAVDRVAFTPHWWHSADTIRRRGALSACFVVAEADEQILGYLEAERQPYAAHVNRIAVAPERQAQGIGSALLAHALCSLWRSGVAQVTLNTQGDNVASLRLYRRFGFEPTGDGVLAWSLQL